MKYTIVAVLILIAVAAAQSPPQGSIPPGKGQWYWFENCSDGRRLGIEVLLDGKAIHHSTFPICRASNPPQAKQQKIVPFFFRGGHVFQGQYSTRRTKTIEGNVWKAGADPEAIVVGVSFATERRVLLEYTTRRESGRVYV